MTLTQSTAYHGKGASRRLRAHGGRTSLAALKELGDVELPDATLTEAEKLALREKIRAVAVGRSVQACMFAAGSWENEARAKQDEGRRSMAS